MKCPACKNDLEEIIIDDIAVDACQNGCGGIWFDRFEHQKVDEPHESAGEKLLDNSEASPETDELMRNIYCWRSDAGLRLVEPTPRRDAGYWMLDKEPHQ